MTAIKQEYLHQFLCLASPHLASHSRDRSVDSKENLQTQFKHMDSVYSVDRTCTGSEGFILLYNVRKVNEEGEDLNEEDVYSGVAMTIQKVLQVHLSQSKENAGSNV